MIGEFNLKIAEAVTLVIAAAAFSASLGFLTLGFVFLGIFALVREFSGSVWFKGPSYAAAAAATPRVDVEKGPQAAAAHEYVVASSQVTSRCLVQKHPDFLFVKRKEEREEGKMREDGGDTVLLVRGLQENTMVVRCGAGSTARDLSDSLRVRTSVSVHLFFLVVEGRVIDGDELVRSLGRDCVVSMRGRVLGGSRNVSRMDLSWLFCGQGAGRPRTRAFVVVRHVPIPLCPLGPVLNNSRPARAPREQRHPGRVPGNAAGGSPTERRTPPASCLFCSVSSFGAHG